MQKSKLEIYEDELDKADAELDELRKRFQEKLLPETQKKIDELEINLIKIEKLKRLHEIDVLDDAEYTALKKKIIALFNE